MKQGPLLSALSALVVLAAEAAAQPQPKVAPVVPVPVPEFKWREVTWLSHHIGHAMAYDPVRERTVMFGGYSTNTGGDNTWEWDGKTWHKRFPRTRPPGRLAHCMAYDPVRKTVLMFGGADFNYKLFFKLFNDTWEWDGNEWQRLFPKNSPGPRASFKMATDFTRKQIVLFGGSTGPGQVSGDTWIWDGSNWIKQSPLTWVMPRYGHEMCFNPLTGRAVLFGGVRNWLSAADNETYEWDGKDWVHAKVKVKPDGAVTHTLTFDPILNRVILRGGTSTAPNWTWDGLQWQPLPVRLNPPRHTRGYRAVTDLARKQIVLFGYQGQKDFQYGAQTWTFDGRNWQLLHKWGGYYPKVIAYAYPLVVHDTARDEFVIIGAGQGEPGKSYLFNTWVMRNERYIEKAPKTVPPWRFPRALCYHSGMQKTVMFGGDPYNGTYQYLEDVWTWDGTNWQEHPTSKKKPWPGKMFAQAAYDSRRKKVVYVGGSGDTWEWDEKGWVKRIPLNRPRMNDSLAYDPKRGRTVLWIRQYSRTRPSELWEWDGQNWQQIKPKIMPPPWGTVAFCYSHDLGGVVLITGYPTTKPTHETWLWDGKAWTLLKNVESWRVGPQNGYWKVAYDANRQRLRMFNFSHYMYEHDLSAQHLFARRPYPRPGQSAILDVVYPGRSQPFWLALSTGNWPGIPLRDIPYVGQQRLPLKADTLLDLSIQAGTIIQLDQRGRGSFIIPIPQLSSLLGYRFYGAGILLGAKGQIDAISNEVEMEVIR